MAGKNSKPAAKGGNKAPAGKKAAAEGDESFGDFMDRKLGDYPVESDPPPGRALLTIKGASHKADKHRITLVMDYKEPKDGQEIEEGTQFKRVFQGFDTTNAGDMQRFKDLCLALNVKPDLTTRQIIERKVLTGSDVEADIAITGPKPDDARIFVNANNLRAPSDG